MSKTFSFLFLFLFFVSCGKGGSGSSSGPNAQISDADLQGETAPVAAQTFEVHVDMTGFTRNQEDKIHEAMDMIKRVIGTDQFKKRVLGYLFNGRRQFNNNNGQTNAQIYKTMLLGSEKLTPGSNNAMDIQIRPYFENSTVIGYTMPNTGAIYLNTKFLDMTSFTPNQVAMNLTHEWLHKLGYGHDFNNTPTRPYSVPYAIGYIMRDLAGQL